MPVDFKKLFLFCDMCFLVLKFIGNRTETSFEVFNLFEANRANHANVRLESRAFFSSFQMNLMFHPNYEGIITFG